MLSRKGRPGGRRFRVRWYWVLGVLLLMLFVAAEAAAITQPDVLAVLGVQVQGILDAGRDALCALGATPMCPSGPRPWK